MVTADYTMEGDNCPQCGEGVVEAHFQPKFHLECSNCEAEWDDKGILIKDIKGD